MNGDQIDNFMSALNALIDAALEEHNDNVHSEGDVSNAWSHRSDADYNLRQMLARIELKD